MGNSGKKIILAKPRGFCAGVTRAIKTVEKAIELYGTPVFVNHQIVHNQRVVDMLERKGARFVESLSEIPEESVTVFSAHGVSPVVREEARQRRLKVIDATCPLVANVHWEAKKFHQDGYAIFLIGHKGHQEVVGVMGEAPVVLIENIDDVNGIEPGNFQKTACLTQTTLSVDDTALIIAALKKKFPDLVLPPRGDICYATQNRQEAVKRMALIADIILVIGSKSSSNSNRLAETAGDKGFLISGINEIDEKKLDKAGVIGITAGASTPDVMVEEVVEFVKNRYEDIDLEEMEREDELMVFPLPAELG